MSNSKTITKSDSDVQNDNSGEGFEIGEQSDRELYVSPTLALADQIDQIEQKFKRAYEIRDGENVYLTYTEIDQTLRDVLYDELHNSDVVMVNDTVVMPEREKAQNDFINLYLTPPDENTTQDTPSWWDVDHYIGTTYRLSILVVILLTIIRLLMFGITTFL